jgi:hypothetical protein
MIIVYSEKCGQYKYIENNNQDTPTRLWLTIIALGKFQYSI